MCVEFGRVCECVSACECVAVRECVNVCGYVYESLGVEQNMSEKMCPII